jgi:hypothetical protein
MIAKAPEMLNLPKFFSEAANGGGDAFRQHS